MNKGINKTGVTRLIKVIAFLGVFVLLLSIFSLILVPKANTKDAGIRVPMLKSFHGEPNNTLDFVAFGNSNLYRSISPVHIWNEYGYTGFNTAIPSVKMSEMYYMLLDVYSVQKPKLVIIDVGAAFDYKKNKTEPTALKSAMKYLSGEIGAFDDNFAAEINQLFPAVQYHSRWKSLTVQDFTAMPDYSKRDPQKGFVIDAHKKPYKGKGNYMKKTDQFEPMHISDRNYMDKIVQLARDNGSQVLLTGVPDARSWDYKRHNTVERYAQENNLLFLDLNIKNKELGIDWKNDTKDGGEHMNIYGARKVSSYLGKYLSENFDLSDRRGKPAYSQWHKDAEQYEKNIYQKILELQNEPAKPKKPSAVPPPKPQKP